jgi:hypothetical protein
MGQEIVYCFKCQIRLLGSDFEKGKAFRVGTHVACLDCMRELLKDDKDPEGELERRKRAQMAKAAESPQAGTGFHKIPSAASRGGSSTGRIPMVTPPLGTPSSLTGRTPAVGSHAQAAPSTNRLPLVFAAAGVVVLLLAFFVFRGSPEPPRRENPVDTSGPVPPPLPVRPEPSPVKTVALKLEELDARLLVHRRAKAYDAVAKGLAEARPRSTEYEWQRGIDERLRALDAETAELAAPLAERAAAAWRRGDEQAADGLRRQVEAIGTAGAKAALERALAAAREDPWVVLPLREVVSEKGATFSTRPDGAVLVGGTNPDRDTFTAAAEVGVRKVRAFRLEAMADPSLGAGGPGRAENGNIVLTEFKVLSGERPLAFAGASADYEQDKFPSSAAIDGNPLTGWALAGASGRTSTAWFHLAAPADLDRVRVVVECQSKWARHVLGCFRISVSRIELPAPPPPRPADVQAPDGAPPAAALDLSPDLKLWKGAWSAAAPRVASHDFSGAAREIEKASGVSDPALKAAFTRDLADLRAAAELQVELSKLVLRWAKGAKVKVDFIGPSLSPELLEGVVLESTPRGISVQAADGVLDLPVGELGAEAAAALVALRGEKRPGDARALEVFGAADGRPSPSFSPEFAKSRRPIDAKESEARGLFWKAEDAFASARTRARSAADYAALLARGEEVAFVARNKPFLEARLQGAAEIVFFADELAAGGLFVPVSTAKGDLYWLSQGDAPPGKSSGFLEAEVLVPAGGTLRAWVYAGGCCQEVFTMTLQGTGLSGPSARNPKETVTAPPGGEESIAVRPPALGLKRKHSDHNGPKTPERWGWVELGVLKFAEPGVQKLRILTDQKGLAVSTLVVGSTRQSPPGDLQALAKLRPGLDLRPTGTILRELWRNLQGGGVGDLTSSPRFQEGKPDEAGPITYIDSWNMGENYGCRIRGYVHPPATGAYTFWIASDDASELWLSADDTPAKKQKICSCGAAVGHYEWERNGSQKSAPVMLTEGKRYYIEVLHKQGFGPEHVAAGWQLPDGTMERAIPPSRLSQVTPFPPRKSPRPTLRPVPADGGDVDRAPLLGGKEGGAAFEDYPQPRLFLKGIRYAVSGSGCFRSLQPLYLGPTATVEGRKVGGSAGEAVVDLVAKPGYAVGGMSARATERFNSFKLIFMKISGTRLDATDAYESPWVGGQNGGQEIRQGGDGRPAVGLYGRAGEEIDSAALIFAGK